MNGIVCAGNWVLDQVKMLDAWPSRGELCSIISETQGPGGSPFNLLVGYAHLGIDFPTWGMGCIGDDHLGQAVVDICSREKINTRYLHILPDVVTSYTDVMTLAGTGERTFFHCRGANAEFSPAHVCLETLKDLSPQIFHMGYLLLLDKMDSKDATGNVEAASMLKSIQGLGIQTSIDVVSEASDRFEDVIKPCLPYVDHLVINEVEAGNITGIEIRRADGGFDRAGTQAAAKALMGMGVKQTVVIHLPEGAAWLGAAGEFRFQASLSIPSEKIVGSVGAGDAFCAGILWGLHEGWSSEKTIFMASAIAAACLSAANSTDGIGTRAEVEALIEMYR